METEGGPQITFKSHSYSFGEIDSGQVPTHTFPFENTGDMDLIILKSRPSCSCVTAVSTLERIPPGGKAEIRVTYDSRGRQGPDRKIVYVHTNDLIRQVVSLTIMVHVKSMPHPSIELVPRYFDLGVMETGSTRTADLRVRNVGDKDLLILRLHAPEGAEVEPPPEATVPPGREAPIRIRVKATIRSGVQAFPFSVESNDPFHSKGKGIAFFAACYVPPPAGPSLRVEPAGLHLGVVGGDAVRREVSLYNPGGETLIVEGAERAEGDPRLVLEVEPGTRIAPREEGTAVVSFLGGGVPGPIRGRFLIRSNDTVFPERTVDTFARVEKEAPSPAGPAIFIGHAEWEMGVIEAGDAHSHGLRVFNQGSETLEIQGVHTYQEFNPFEIEIPPPIPPGGRGEVRFTVYPGGIAGIADTSFEIRSNDPMNPAINFDVRGYGKEAAADLPEGSRRLSLLYMSDEAGEIQACGCGEAHLGGLAPAATLIREVRDREGAVLLVGGGDLFGRGEAHYRLRADLAASAYSRMGVDAITPGEMDFSFGAGVLQEILKGTGLVATSLNIVKKKGGARFAVPSVTKELGGMRVSVIGVSAPGIFDPRGAEVEVMDPEKTLREMLPEVRARSDLVILLAHMGRKRTLDLVGKVRGIDVVVIGHSEEGFEAPKRIGRTFVVENGGGGKTVGHLEITLTPDGRVLAKGKRVPVDEKVIEPDREITALLEKYRADLGKLPAPPFVPLENSPFVSSAACAECHPAAFESWKRTGHARAFESLKEVGSEFDPECARCHVVAWEGTPGGFVRADVTPERVDVGCETCHGPGRRHVEAREAGRKEPYSPGHIKNLCDNCHTRDRSPLFSYEPWWQKIRHGEEE